MSIELPKDAEGREIPLDTVVLFGGNDNAYNITGWIYVTDFDLSNSMAGQWRALTDKFTRLDPELMYLTPSDSWKRLKEDLRRTMGASDAVCAYFGGDNRDCVACRLNKESFKGIPYCNPCLAFTDILDRIRKLRGEDDG